MDDGKSDGEGEEGGWRRKEEKRKEGSREGNIYAALAGRNQLGRRDPGQEEPESGRYTKASQMGRHVSIRVRLASHSSFIPGSRFLLQPLGMWDSGV